VFLVLPIIFSSMFLVIYYVCTLYMFYSIHTVQRRAFWNVSFFIWLFKTVIVIALFNYSCSFFCRFEKQCYGNTMVKIWTVRACWFFIQTRRVLSKKNIETFCQKLTRFSVMHLCWSDCLLIWFLEVQLKWKV